MDVKNTRIVVTGAAPSRTRRELADIMLGHALCVAKRFGQVSEELKNLEALIGPH